MSKSTGCRKWKGLFYGTKEQLLDVFEEEEVNAYAFIEHEAYYKEEEERKRHIHFIVDLGRGERESYFRNPKNKYCTLFAKMLPYNNGTGYYDYLTHKNNPEKLKWEREYSEDEIISYKAESLLSKEEQKTNAAWDIICDMEAGATYKELVKRYGFSFVTNIKNFEHIMGVKRYK